MPDDPFKPIGKGRPQKAASPKWLNVVPVPTDAVEAPRQHPTLGLPAATWTYRDAAGKILGHVLRFERPQGKEYRPCCYFEAADGSREWRWESWAEPRPLYGLERLARRPDDLVVVCEGEKSADAVEQLLECVGVTSPAGAKSGAKANWQSLSGRNVMIWPDHDSAGEAFAVTVAKLLTIAGATSIRVISPPGGKPPGWDAADALEEGYAGVNDLVAAAADAASGEKPKAGPAAGSTTRGPRQRDALLASADGAELWHSPEKVAFATVKVNAHQEHYRLDSSAFRRWVAGRFYEATGNAPAGQMLADALRVLEVRAIENGPCHKPAMRTAWHDGASWLDLCDDKWRAVRVHANGWEIVADPPVKFVRTETMSALPDPEAGDTLESQLRQFINAEEGDYKLIVSWLVGTMWGRATGYPVLALGGEQGSGKSTMAKALRTLCDPSAVAALALPRDERDLFTMAMSGLVLSFDNVSKVDAWFSDAVCRLATGSGFLTRKLHSDSDPFWFQGSRPVLLNGIPSLTDRADLAERALTVRLKRIDEHSRRSDDDWWEAWEKAQPRILGALLDAISSAVRKYDQVKRERSPRMAAFAKLMTAAEGALGWEAGEFDKAYDENVRETSDVVFESDPVAVAVHKLMTVVHEYAGHWEGTATSLLAELNALVAEDVRRSRFWPAKVNALGNAVDRASPLLRHKGIHVSKRHTGNQRMIILTVGAPS